MKYLYLNSILSRLIYAGILFIVSFASTLDAQTFKDALERPASPERHDESSGPKNTGKRYAILCTQTHGFDYLTGLPKEDRLYRFSYCSLDWMNDMCREFGAFDGGVAVLAGINLTRENVLGVFDLLAKKTKPNDEIFIYWHGHGGTGLPNTDGTEADGYDEFLVLFETDFSSAQAARKTSITDDDFGKMIASLKDRRILLAVETCHAGGLLQGETSGNSRGIKSFHTKPFTLEAWEELQRNPFANSRRHDYAAVTGLQNVPVRNPNESRPATLQGALTGNRSKTSDNAVLMTRFLTKSVERAKDISQTQPKLTAIFTCKEAESSYAGAFIKKDKGIFLDSVAYAFVLTVALGKEDFVKDKDRVFFTEFGECAKVVIKNLMEELEDAVQTPVFVDTLGPAYLRPPKNER